MVRHGDDAFDVGIEGYHLNGARLARLIQAYLYLRALELVSRREESIETAWYRQQHAE